MINRTPALVAASLNLGLDIFGRQWGEYRLERDVMPCLLTTKTEALMTTVMADDQHTDSSSLTKRVVGCSTRRRY